jgi:hypothetical protein
VEPNESSPPGLWKCISKFTDHIEIHRTSCVTKPKVLGVLKDSLRSNTQGKILVALLASFVSVLVSHKLIDGIFHDSGPQPMEMISIVLEIKNNTTKNLTTHM